MRLLSLLTAVLAATSVYANDMKFSIYGDWGVGPNFITSAGITLKNGFTVTGPQLGHLMSKTEASVVSQFQNVSDVFQPEFILSTGDQFYDDGLFSRDDPQFTTKFKNVYTSPGVNCTWYLCLGNHDYYQNPSAELNRTMDDWRWYFPSKYYNFSKYLDDGTEVLFVVLDVTPALLKYRDEKGIKDATAKYYHKQLVQNLQAEKAAGTWAVQLKWAEQVLTYSRAEWKFVMAHEPIYATTNTNTFVELQQQLQPILERTGVSAVFAGHFHTLDITENNNIAYIISGAASQVPYPIGNGTAAAYAEYFTINNITGTYDPSLSNVTPVPTINGTTRYPTDAPLSQKTPNNPQKNIFHGGDEMALPGFMNARLNTTHLSIDVWGLLDNQTWAIVYEYVTLRIDLKPYKQVGNLKFNIIGDWGVGPNFVSADKKDFQSIHTAAGLTTAQYGHLLGLTEAAVASEFQNVSDIFYPQFVISTGDQFYDNGLWTYNDTQFHDKFTAVFSSVGVQVPWYPCLGNHDYYINPDNELNRTDDWRWVFPSKYYNFSYSLDDGSEVLFVVLDVNVGLYSYRAEAGILPGGKYYRKNIVQLLQAAKASWPIQLAWAENLLNSTTAKWKIVIGHEPVYSSTGSNSFGELQRDLQPILERTNVTAYLSGHYHTLELLETNGVQYIISGAASQIPYPIGNGTAAALVDYFSTHPVTATPTPDSTATPPTPAINSTLYPTDPTTPTPQPAQYVYYKGGSEKNLPGFMTASINSTTNILHIDVYAMADNGTWSIVATRDIIRKDLKPFTPATPTPTSPSTTTSPPTTTPSPSSSSSSSSSSTGTNMNPSSSSTGTSSTTSTTTASTGSTGNTTMSFSGSSGSNSNTSTPSTGSSSTNPNTTTSSTGSSSSTNPNTTISSSSTGVNGNPNMAIVMTPIWGILLMLVVALLA